MPATLTRDDDDDDKQEDYYSDPRDVKGPVGPSCPGAWSSSISGKASNNSREISEDEFALIVFAERLEATWNSLGDK